LEVHELDFSVKNMFPFVVGSLILLQQLGRRGVARAMHHERDVR